MGYFVNYNNLIIIDTPEPDDIGGKPPAVSLLTFDFAGSKSIAAIVFVMMFVWATSLSAQQKPVARIPIGYINQQIERPPDLSNLEETPEDEGFAGGRISILDNNTTGQFLGQKFELVEVDVAVGADPLAAFNGLVDQGVQFIVANVPADTLLQLSDAAKDRDVLFFNAGAPDNRLRDEDCRANVMHIGPSRAMYTDALAQFLVRKKWRDWFLITGPRDGDGLFAESMKQSARKFGGKIVADRIWDFGPDARRTAQAEVPAFTQGVDHDVIVVADELGVFGEYIMYRTWEPRPVVGTQGLRPTTWHKTHEQWGSAQLQSRFKKRFKRPMTAIDYLVWAPIRAIGEGATRTHSADFDKIVSYIKSPNFELAGFKGLPLTFRDWNWQLRQPILLVQPAAVVSRSPQEGFLHRRSLLDTMGSDKQESKCKF